MLRERLLDRIPAEEFAAAGREVAERRRDPYSILEDWLKQGWLKQDWFKQDWFKR
jgi:hypothetical protein